MFFEWKYFKAAAMKTIFQFFFPVTKFFLIEQNYNFMWQKSEFILFADS